MTGPYVLKSTFSQVAMGLRRSRRAYNMCPQLSRRAINIEPGGDEYAPLTVLLDTR